MRRTLTMAVTALTALALLALPGHAAPPEHAEVNRALAQARAATAKYQNVASAEAAGFVPISPCVPEMGIHYARMGEQGPIVANGVDRHLAPTDPEILVYAPQPNGRLKLVAVEYGHVPNYLAPDEESDAGPAKLFGQTFDDSVEALGIYTLHAWVWSPNPDGMFEAHNPRITSCPELEMPPH